MKPPEMEMRFCRRCGTALTRKQNHVYTCQKGHIIYGNASPAMGLILMNDKNEVLILERADDPGKGRLDIPGGFCDGSETIEAATQRELQEEVGFGPADYSVPTFVCSAIDYYEYGDETVPVLGLIFRADLKTGKQPQAADDAASARFVPLAELDLDKVQFPSVKAGLAKLKSQIN